MASWGRCLEVSFLILLLLLREPVPPAERKPGRPDPLLVVFRGHRDGPDPGYQILDRSII